VNVALAHVTRLLSGPSNCNAPLILDLQMLQMAALSLIRHSLSVIIAYMPRGYDKRKDIPGQLYLFKIHEELDGGYYFRRAERIAKKQRRDQLLRKLDRKTD